MVLLALALTLYVEPTPPARFAATEIRLAAGATVERDLAVLGEAREGPRMVLASGEAARRAAAKLGIAWRPGAAQSYSIRRRGETTAVLAADPAGAMYGGLDLAEALRLGAEIRDSDHAPHIARRGIKFNLPLDLRTPSYSDAGDAAQQNIPEMWSFDFWREFLDSLARHRFNVLTLWNLHPFPSMVQVPEYPDVALDDVQRTRVKFDSTFSLTGSDMLRPAMLTDVETVRRMSIAQKIAFWRDVMQHAHDRGIEVYFFTWNIFTWGAAPKYGITDAQDNPVTLDYFRKSVRETVRTYPLLAGIGITAGEHMQNRKDELAKEKWLWKTYGEGIRDALAEQPGREFRLIHRYHQSALEPILAEFRRHPGPFDLSFKYAVAHMYSSPAPPFARAALAELPSNLRMWMTVRNDDIYSFRWGDPAYARAFIRNLPGPDKLAGFYMGPDGYIWGREFLSTEPETPRELVIAKQWYSFMLWGRLSYDPTLPDSLFERTLARRFPQAPSAKLFAASNEASRIIPLVTRFFWGDIDLKWFPEACISHPKHKGWYTVKHFAEGETMPGSGILNIREYRAGRRDGITPPQVAAELKEHAAAALKLAAELRPAQGRELRLTLGDYEAMAHLGNYYAEKILGAVELGNPEAVKHLEAALEHWKKYAAAATAQYKPQMLTRIGYVDLNALTEKVRADIALAKSW
ncbi:MAG: carbohydrate-binding family 6 protein [Bryobacteraceae bacterium]